MTSYSLNATKTEDRLPRYSGQLSQDCRKYITQNFDFRQSAICLGKKYRQIYPIIVGKPRSQKGAEDNTLAEMLCKLKHQEL